MVCRFGFSFLTGAAGQAAAPEVLFQTSTLQALMNGVYDGDLSFGELARHGDLGLGTFEALDGEMGAVDGKFFQVKTDGKAYPVSPDQRTPFAEVVFFKADQTLDLSEPLDLKQLEQYLSDHMASPNFPYAFKITGKFSYIKTRSVPRQAKPYPPLGEVAKQQAVFEFQEVEGVIVGFSIPSTWPGSTSPVTMGIFSPGTAGPGGTCWLAGSSRPGWSWPTWMILSCACRAPRPLPRPT